MTKADSTPSDLPIFDSLTHPSLDGTWLNQKWNGKNDFQCVVTSLREAGVRWAWAVAMGVEGPYDVSRYVDECSRHDVRLFPAAFMPLAEFRTPTAIEAWLTERKQQGYLGIKLHPRLSRFSFDHPLLPTAIRLANQNGLAVFVCTYCYSGDTACRGLSVESLRELLYAVPDEKLILLHSGTLRLLELAEITRSFKRTMLDLSYTLCEFAGSSLDLDLRFVMDRCRHRICIGSDSPEFTPRQMRDRFFRLTDGFTREHLERIAFRNLFEFTGLPLNGN